jgi:hypothetical protein
MYIQVSVRDITLEYLQIITPTKFRESKFPGNMHNYIEHRLSNFLEWGTLP